MDQAEQLRIIKANNQIRPTARVITVTSGKGGVGKSNMSINLAIQFRKMGKRVIILDADFGLANIEIMFGAIPKHNLCDLVYEGKSISDIITWGPMEVGFISGGSGIACFHRKGGYACGMYAAGAFGIAYGSSSEQRHAGYARQSGTEYQYQ